MQANTNVNGARLQQLIDGVLAPVCSAGHRMTIKSCRRVGGDEYVVRRWQCIPCMAERIDHQLRARGARPFAYQLIREGADLGLGGPRGARG